MSVVLPAAASRPSSPLVASVSGSAAVLGNGVVTRRWSLDGGAVRTTALRSGRRNLVALGPDFALNLDGVPTSSVAGWQLSSMTPARNALVFRYAFAGGAQLEHTVTLLLWAAVFEVASTLLTGAVPARISDYSLDEVVAPAASVEVQRYVGGSDWRDDYRTSVAKKRAFDDEGGIARTTTVTAPGCSWSPSAVVGQRPASGTLTGPCFAGYLAPIGLLSHLTFWTDQSKIPVAARPELAFSSGSAATRVTAPTWPVRPTH